ncbi:MAG: AAA family ATPase [Dehalococcoidia bacterium]|nr:AAA family ATPase [Dehalococcoidia bacterium]
MVDDLDGLLQALPQHLRNELRNGGKLNDLLEVVMDLGRIPLARFRDVELDLGAEEVGAEDIDYVISRIGEFGDDNRAGIERMLHRISCMRNRKGKVIGLTLRVGRAVFGTIDIIDDLVFGGKSILLLGRPGVGKTTMLREVARVLADSAKKRAIVVDTSNEIAGDGDIPHPAIGRARRMQVKSPADQHNVMIEAVENHMPQVIVIDEMGTELEASAARTIAERGVQLIATAHGNTLENLIMNPTLSDLVGGIQSVTLSDEEARRRGTQKTVLERKSPPTFNILVEIQSWDRLVVYDDVASAVDKLLRGYEVIPEIRWVDENGVVRKGEAEPVFLESVTGTGAEENASPFPPEPRGWRNRGRAPDYDRRGRPGGGDFDRDRRPSAPPERREAARSELNAPNAPAPPPAGHAAQPPPRSGAAPRAAGPMGAPPGKVVRVYPFGVSRDRLFQGGRNSSMDFELVEDPAKADVVLTTKTHYRRRPEVLKTAEQAGKPIYVLRRNSQGQIEQFARSLTTNGQESASKKAQGALEEAEDAAMHVASGSGSVELEPQSAYLRRLQHQVAERYNLASASTGREPQRRVIIYRE